MIEWPTVPSSELSFEESQTRWITLSYFGPNPSADNFFLGFKPIVLLQNIEKEIITQTTLEKSKKNDVAKDNLTSKNIPVCNCGEIICFTQTVFSDKKETVTISGNKPWKCLFCLSSFYDAHFKSLSAHQNLLLFSNLEEKAKTCLFRS